jgi:hypothetical protein
LRRSASDIIARCRLSPFRPVHPGLDKGAASTAPPADGAEGKAGPCQATNQRETWPGKFRLWWFVPMRGRLFALAARGAARFARGWSWQPRIEIGTLYLRTVCFRTAVPNWVLGFRWLGTVAPHPDSQGTRSGHGPGLRGPGPYLWGADGRCPNQKNTFICGFKP